MSLVKKDEDLNKLVLDQLVTTMDAVYRDISSYDSNKVAQFLVKNEILAKQYTSYSNFTHRIKVATLSGLSRFILDKIAQDTIEDGWEFVFNEDRKYDDDEIRDIERRVQFIKEVLDNLQFESFEDILKKIIIIKRRDRFGAIVPSFGNFKTEDLRVGGFRHIHNSLDRKNSVRVLRRLQVFPEASITIDDTDLDEIGTPITLKIKIQKVKASGQKKFDIEKDRIVLFRANHKPGSPIWVGTPVLESVWYYILYLEWTAFSGADYANNRGSFLWLKRLLSNATATKLSDLHKTLQYVFTRNGAVTDDTVELQQVGPGGTAVPIDAIMDKIYELLATGTGIPMSKLKGAQKGQLASAKEDRLDYFPVLKEEQRFLEPIVKKIIEMIDPTIFRDYDLDIRFNLTINLSDVEKEDYLNKKLQNYKDWIDILVALRYTRGEIIEIINDSKILPVQEHEVERNSLVLADVPKQPDFKIEAPTLPESEQADLEYDSLLDEMPPETLLRGLLKKSDDDIDAFCARARITKETLSKVINAVKIE